MSLHTTLGAVDADDLGLVLPHEHVFVELGEGVATHYARADPDAVASVMAPHAADAMDAGVTALVECTPVGVGRRVDVVRAVSAASGLPMVVPTGVYREPWVPDWVREASEAALADWMHAELTEGVGATGVRAAWIKLSASPDGLTDCETKLLRAAGRAAADTNALVGSHTTDADVVERQLDVLEAVGHDADRFVWIHAQAASDRQRHLDVAERGAYVEYDWIGTEGADETYLDGIEALLAAGHADRLLLSQDRGWYDPSEPGGGDQRPYTYLPETFLPALVERVGEATARRLTHENPVRAFSR